MNEVYTITSDNGDEYKLQFTTDRSGIIADEILDYLCHEGVEVVEIGLGRSSGFNVTTPTVLAQIEDIVADLLHRHPNAILSFFCDFINTIPSTKKKIPVQEYRSHLFSLMFNRYVSQHHIKGLHNLVTVVQGVKEPYYFHVIAWEHHLKYAKMILRGHQNDFGKPE